MHDRSNYHRIIIIIIIIIIVIIIIIIIIIIITIIIIRIIIITIIIIIIITIIIIIIITIIIIIIIIIITIIIIIIIIILKRWFKYYLSFKQVLRSRILENLPRNNQSTIIPVLKHDKNCTATHIEPLNPQCTPPVSFLRNKYAETEKCERGQFWNNSEFKNLKSPNFSVFIFVVASRKKMGIAWRNLQEKSQKVSKQEFENLTGDVREVGMIIRTIDKLVGAIKEQGEQIEELQEILKEVNKVSIQKLDENILESKQWSSLFKNKVGVLTTDVGTVHGSEAETRTRMEKKMKTKDIGMTK